MDKILPRELIVVLGLMVARMLCPQASPGLPLVDYKCRRTAKRDFRSVDAKEPF